MACRILGFLGEWGGSVFGSCKRYGWTIPSKPEIQNQSIQEALPKLFRTSYDPKTLNPIHSLLRRLREVMVQDPACPTPIQGLFTELT